MGHGGEKTPASERPLVASPSRIHEVGTTPSALRPGGRYRRRKDIHEALGLGGNRQKGISYPAKGDYVLLFSDPQSPYGKLDGWESPFIFRYSGEWNGTGDMRLVAGNAKIVERKANIHLFVADGEWMRYEGRFELLDYHFEPHSHGHLRDQALVFRLRWLESRDRQADNASEPRLELDPLGDLSPVGEPERYHAAARQADARLDRFIRRKESRRRTGR